MKTLNTLVTALLLTLAGCASESSAPTADAGAADTKTGTAAAYLLSNEPAEVVEVGAARESAQNDQAVTVVGRIGGSAKPFVDGIAAFTIVDMKVQYCADDEGCPTPWDYCCHQDDVKTNIATVKLVDENGKTLTGDARELLGVKELSEVVVEATAKRDDQGNMTLAASKVFVRTEK